MSAGQFSFWEAPLYPDCTAGSPSLSTRPPERGGFFVPLCWNVAQLGAVAGFSWWELTPCLNQNRAGDPAGMSISIIHLGNRSTSFDWIYGAAADAATFSTCRTTASSPPHDRRWPPPGHCRKQTAARLRELQGSRDTKEGTAALPADRRRPCRRRGGGPVVQVPLTLRGLYRHPLEHELHGKNLPQKT